MISVDDIREAMNQVAKAGGSVLGEPMEVPSVGHYIFFVDSENNHVSMLGPFPCERFDQR